MSGKRFGGGCPYNYGIDCDDPKCEHGGRCGWHPLIKEYRKRLLEKSELKMKPIRTDVDISGLTLAQQREREKRLKNAQNAKERRKRLLAEGRCISCGQINDRPGKTKCGACWQREQLQRKLREVFIGEL